MLVVFLLAVAASTLLDKASEQVPSLQKLDREPYQDGFVLALFSLPALALIWVVSSWSLRPLHRASREAQLAGPANPTVRLSRDGMPGEIAPLVDAVNGALGRMSDAFEAERRFTENAAHELRTPLAVLGLRLQRARASNATPDWQAIDSDLAQMNRLVSQMLDLARKEHAGRGDTDMVVMNLSRVAREAAAMVLPLAEARGRPVIVDLPETMEMRGRAGDLRDALCNLLENAIIHGKGTISLEGRVAGALIEVTVTDEGVGIPKALRAHLFERFGKGGVSDGSGLGLAIVREVARSHGGEAALVEANTCRFRLTLPRHSTG